MKRYIQYPRVAGTASRQAHADLPPGTYEREMGKEGFFPYPWEWWHFDWKDFRDYPVLDVPFGSIKRLSPVEAAR